MGLAEIVMLLLGFMFILLAVILIGYSITDLITTSVWYHRRRKRKKK